MNCSYCGAVASTECADTSCERALCGDHVWLVGRKYYCEGHKVAAELRIIVASLRQENARLKLEGK